MAVFLFNYLTRVQMLAVLKLARDRLAPGGIFVFTVPTPCFPYMRAPAAPFFFRTEGRSYFDGVDATYEGCIWRRDGTDVPVRCVHKTFEDYFSLLAEAGWNTLPKLLELSVQAGAGDPRSRLLRSLGGAAAPRPFPTGGRMTAITPEAALSAIRWTAKSMARRENWKFTAPATL